jgi:hypothetical protein
VASGSTSNGNTASRARGDSDRTPNKRQSEQPGHQKDHEQLEGQELSNHGDGLAEEHRGLVDRRQQQSLQRTVFALVLIRATEREHGREQDGEPQQSRRGLLEKGSAGAQGEPERDQERCGEGEDRGQRIPAADLDAQILSGNRKRLGEKRHRAPAPSDCGR